jgi:hypothetical protein
VPAVIKKSPRERKFKEGVVAFIDRLVIEEEQEERVEYFVASVLKKRTSEKKGFG